jgi:hypothetical protein
LNHPVDDDLAPSEDGSPRKLVDQMDIGRRGIELAVLGGFEKCTWDGAYRIALCASLSYFIIYVQARATHILRNVGIK